MKKVHIEFKTEEQAEAFFGLFDDRAHGSIEKEAQVERTINNAMRHCGVDCVETRKGEEAYELKLS